tara:strand:+ start:271 stop:699 length:429 start_codon:yes stop_codon:yes gene_type:complete
MKRSIQELFDEKRQLDEMIDQAEDAKRRRTELLKELDNHKMDLVKEKKIKWVEMTFEKWLEEDGEDQFHIFMTDTGNSYGVWQGRDKLNITELDHFDKYVNDYHYYGHPYYVDRNHQRAEMTECELAFEGDCRLVIMSRHDL